MTSVQFAYWLQGLFELGDPKTLNEHQVDLIKKHLNMVFVHEIDPSYPKEQQQALNDAHNSKQCFMCNNKGCPVCAPSKDGKDSLYRC